MESNVEKRKITRVEYPIKGQIKYNGIIINGEIINLSLNGLLFQAEKIINISEQAKVDVLFQWHDENIDTDLTINCVVIRKVNYILGLQFDIIDLDTLMFLKERLSEKIGHRINEEFIKFLMAVE